MKYFSLSIILLLISFKSFCQTNELNENIDCNNYVLSKMEITSGGNGYVKVDSLETLCKGIKKFKRENWKFKHSKSKYGKWEYLFFSGADNYIIIRGAQVKSSISVVMYYYVNINAKNNSSTNKSSNLCGKIFPQTILSYEDEIKTDSILGFNLTKYTVVINDTTITDSRLLSSTVNEFNSFKKILNEKCDSVTTVQITLNNINNKYQVIYIEDIYIDADSAYKGVFIEKITDLKCLSNKIMPFCENILLFGKSYAISQVIEFIPRALPKDNILVHNIYFKLKE